MYFALWRTWLRSRPTDIFITRDPPGVRNFSAILSTSRQSIALWYWSSSVRPVVFGATSEVMSWNPPLSLIHHASCVPVFAWWISARYSRIFSCVSLAIISPTRVVICFCENLSTSWRSTPRILPFSPTIWESTWSQLPGAHPRSRAIVSGRISEVFSCIWRSLNALRARYPAAFARWNQISWTWYPALFATLGATIFFFFLSMMVAL